MLVNLYKTKTPLAVFSFPIVVAILALPLLFNDFRAQPTFFSWQLDMELAILKQPIVHYLLATFIIYLAGVALNRLVNVFGFFSKNTYLPGLIFAISLLGFKEFIFSSDLIAYTLVIWGMDFLFRINRQDSALSNIFTASFFFGAATVFEPMMAPLLFLSWLTLAVFRSFVWREYLMAIIGLVLPWIYFASLYFVIAGKSAPTPQLFQAEQHELFFTLKTISLIGFLILLVLYSTWRYLMILNTQLLVIKKRSRLLFHLVWMSVISLAIAWWVKDNILLLINVPFSIIIAVAFLNDRKTMFGNSVLFAWLILSAWILYF